MSFENSSFYTSILDCRNFMYDDIEKSIDLAKNSSRGAPNILIALGLSCYIVYWGKLSLCVAIGKSQYVMNVFFAD